jgi:hypothetical protein
VRNVGTDFEVAQPETSDYFGGLSHRSVKAWTLGYAVANFAGLEEQYVWPPGKGSSTSYSQAEISQRRSAALPKKFLSVVTETYKPQCSDMRSNAPSRAVFTNCFIKDPVRVETVFKL